MAGQAGTSGGKPRKRIGELLIDQGVVTPQQLQEALAHRKEKGCKTVEALISLGHLDPDKFIDFLAKQPGVASFDLNNYIVDFALVKLVPRNLAVQHEVFPIDKLGKLLTLGMVCPLDASAIGQLQEATGLRIKPLLCSPQAIRKAIRQYYPAEDISDDAPPPEAAEVDTESLRAPLKLVGIAALVREIETLPALPETVQRVRRAMHDPDSSIDDISSVISLDPPIAAKVLSVANSAAYGFPNRVDSLNLAVTLMGLRETYSIVLSAAVLDMFETSRHFDYEAFWMESVCCAAAARVVAKTAGVSQKEAVFSGGLLHDIGRLALSEVAPERYAKIDKNLDGDALVAAEEEALGVAHPEAGFELANHWNLPEEIADAIRFHHTPDYADQADQKIVCAVTVATRLMRAKELSAEAVELVIAASAFACQTLALNQQKVYAALEEYLGRRDDSLHIR